MNGLLLDRSAGDLGPNAFARLETTRLLHSFQPAPRFLFDGGERRPGLGYGEQKSPIWAHQAGVSSLALERFDGRM
jgi:DNA excision repair protein ERCC-8